MDHGLDSDACDAAPGPEVVEIGGADDDAEVEVSGSLAERLKKVAASLAHLLTHTAKGPYCSVCNWAKALRRQQRKARNKRLKVPRPCANPTSFGQLTTMDH
eukprot:5084066-Pyramimonas_sp.AAC.1